ncbi:MAG TPA: hypothetical protein VF190_08390 [Rhodothermales bacterium]
MLRRFADLVFQHLVNAFPAGIAYPRTSFDREAMPAPIVHYLVQALDARLEVEVSRFRQTTSPWFDLEHPEVRSASGAFAEALTRHGQFPSEEWEATLERAVRNVVSYHARPARTLLDFLFVRDGDVYTPAGLLRKLAFFSPYPHLSDALDEYVRVKQPTEIDRDTVAELLRRIDEQMEAEFDVDGWMKLIDPLYEIASILPEYRDAAPIELLISFFRDKGFARAEQRLERMHEDDGIDVLSVAGLHRVLQELRAPAPRPGHTVRHERVVLPEVTATEDPIPAPAPAPVAPRPAERPVERPAEPVPLWQQFQQAPQAQPIRPVVQAPVQPRVQRHQEAEGEARPLWMRFSENAAPDATSDRMHPMTPRVAPAAAERPRSLSELEANVLGDRAARDRDLYVRSLFGGSREEYEEVLDLLSRARSWSEASRVIANEVFRRHHVNIYSDPAVSFTNAVEARFEES